jgi:serine phosphatase RsbU (regulator of sigma subunit)
MPGQSTTADKLRGEQLFAERFAELARRTDRVFAYLMILQWIFGIVLAVVLAPVAWAGKTYTLHEHVYAAVFFGGFVSALPVALVVLRPGWIGTRMVIACGQMLWSGLLIHLSGGRIETHFHVFGSLAFLMLYRDWRVFVPATVITVANHTAGQVFWPESMFGVLTPEWWRVLEHAGWVVFEEVILVIACISASREMRAAAMQQTTIEARERQEKQVLANELAIATSIQTAVLPRNLHLPGLDCAARMLTATAVGGDYYEFLPVPGGCWLGIGDVAGHGLQAGLVMLQAQSAIEALVLSQPDAEPQVLLAAANRVIFENIRRRLGSDAYITLSLIRYFEDGRIDSAGAHEEALICRAADGRCERVPVEGTWLGVIPEIGAATVQTTHTLEQGDLLILYTDGLTEARDAHGEIFGLDRVTALVEAHAARSVTEIRDQILAAAAAWAVGEMEDDRTLMVLRHLGVADPPPPCLPGAPRSRP